MAQKLILLSLMLTAMAMTACETAKKQEPRTPPPAVRKDFTTIGRDLSEGRVELYQPGTDFLPTMTAPEGSKFAAISPIPGNQNILVNEPGVTIYSLDTMDISEPQPAPLPPLQAPTNLQEEYPSPFDKNGNPVP